MASQPSYEYYKDDLSLIPPLRSIAQTLILDKRVRRINAAEAYDMARQQWDVQETDMPIYPPAAKRLGLPPGATVLNNCQGRIIGRTAKARRFFNRLRGEEKQKVLADLREAVSDMQKRPLVKADAVIGLDRDLMIKATLVAGEDDAMNVFNWLVNFTPFSELAEEYAASPMLPIQDILIVADNLWRTDDPFYHNRGEPQLALVDETANVIFNFGMRYFGERKKGTLTLAWTSGIRMGMVACHGGIKEIDFTGCGPEYADLGTRSIAFFGLSGTGKSSHTNARDNEGTLPEGFRKVVLHDDAFQVDCDAKTCLVWEPTLFDKTDSRELDHPDWKYVISVQNHGLIRRKGKILPMGLDVRNPNGRALLDRDLLGEYVNRCGFPAHVCWLMKDTCLPPVMRFTDATLAVAMGASLMTQRNRAENVSEEEFRRLVFIPFANPFRVYELWRDVAAFESMFEHGATGYSFNSVGMWKSSELELTDISLQASLTLQSAILMDRLEWRNWKLVPGAQIPTPESVEALLPGYNDKYDPERVMNYEYYERLLMDRFQQRGEFLKGSDLAQRPGMLSRLINSLPGVGE